MNNPINWFEIPVEDLNRAIAFYEKLFDAAFRRETIAGIDMAVFPHVKPATGGALVKMAGLTPGEQGTVVYLHTPDLQAALEKVQEAGGRCCMPPQALPHNIGKIAMIIDSEGNRVGLHQPA
ncbi:VOC family protein [Franconibacter daqui]|uniref:VOC family protein n=1 Tax=Franconibacter daqui TaxID=2047724 RepID=UPI002DB82EAE|nr:VOC family protein [Franconibacter daqui]MEB5921572.1 VOC family protein [Franconibacter daqui]